VGEGGADRCGGWEGARGVGWGRGVSVCGWGAGGAGMRDDIGEMEGRGREGRAEESAFEWLGISVLVMQIGMDCRWQAGLLCVGALCSSYFRSEEGRMYLTYI